MDNKDTFHWERIKENENFIVEYDQRKMMYRVSYFEDNHYCDEIVFNAPNCPMGCAGTLSIYDLA
jgi:hypothetical protein